MCQVLLLEESPDYVDDSQAALLLLTTDEKDTPGTDYKTEFSIRGQTLLNGVIFFGTPFKGSRFANLGVQLATWFKFPINKTHIMYLRVEEQNVKALVDEFVTATEQIGLPLLIFYELKKTRVLLFKGRVSIH